MASGSTYTISGGTNMVGVVSGDVIDDADFNNARANVDKLLGTPADTTLGTFTEADNYGIHEGGVGVNAASAGGLVYADNATGGFKRLQDDVQALCAFYGVTVRTGVGSDVSDSTVITAETWTNLMLNIQDVWNTRFAPPTSVAIVGDSSSQQFSWTTQIEQVATYTWSNENDCRSWFNKGMGVGYNAAWTGTPPNDQSSNWASLLSAMGSVILEHDTTTGSSGTSAGIGFYELSTSYQQIWSKFGSGAYASNNIKLYAKVNSTTNPTEIDIKAVYADPYTAAAAAAADNAVGPDGVPGTGDDAAGYTDSIGGAGFTYNGRTALRKHTDESTFGITANPTMNITDLSGT
jgi:hypothetical protein